MLRTEVPPHVLRLWATFHDIINLHVKASVSQDLPLPAAKCISATELGGEEMCPTPPSTVKVPWACPCLGCPGTQAVSGTKTITVYIQDALAMGGAQPTAGRSLSQSSALLWADSRAQGGRNYSICILKTRDGLQQGGIG